MNAASLLSDRARLTPDREAIVDLASGWRGSYAALNARVNRAAHWLRARAGVGKGDRVSILARNCLAHVELLYAAAKIGAVFAPLSWRLSPGELGYIAGDCAPRVLLCDAASRDVAGALGVDRVVDLERDYAPALARASDAEPERPPLDGDDPLCLLYTSGTTGRPKGAVIPHRQVLWNCISTAASWGLRADDVSPVFTPLFHAGGLFVFLTPLHYLGGRVVLGRGFDADRDLDLIERERCTVVLGVPTIYRMWAESDRFATVDLSAVRFLISGGAPCPPSLIETWVEAKRVVFRQGYGLTEVGPNCFSMTDAESVAKRGAVGKPVAHLRMRLVDDDGGDVGDGETGELVFAGPHVCTGYWNDPEATARALRGGWFHTGDMARRDGEGFVAIAGRSKDMIISGGENVYAAEVEAVFAQHPAVAEAALIGRPDERWGEVGVLVAVLRAGSTASAEQLLAFSAERLARFKLPKQILFADELPHTAYGKVIKAELRRRYAS